MKMLKVDNFLGCMELETGGLVIGWLKMAISIIGFILAAFLFVLAYHCDVDSEDALICHIERTAPGLVLVIAIFGIILTIIIGVIAYYCIKGISNRNHNHVKPMMILLACCVVLSLLEILSMSSGLLVAGLVKVLVYGYQYVVMYSIYSLFKEEYERGRTPPQYQEQPNDKV